MVLDMEEWLKVAPHKLGGTEYKVRIDGDRIRCYCKADAITSYPEFQFLEAETTMEHLNNEHVVGTIIRYENVNVPNPDAGPHTPSSAMKILERHETDRREGVELPADIVAFMKLKVMETNGESVELTDKYLDGLFSQNNDERRS